LSNLLTLGGVLGIEFWGELVPVGDFECLHLAYVWMKAAHLHTATRKILIMINYKIKKRNSHAHSITYTTHVHETHTFT